MEFKFFHHQDKVRLLQNSSLHIFFSLETSFETVEDLHSKCVKCNQFQRGRKYVLSNPIDNVI